jgi:hypothetical protein
MQPVLEVDARAVRAATDLGRAEFARPFALDPRALRRSGAGTPPPGPRRANLSEIHPVAATPEPGKLTQCLHLSTSLPLSE